MTAAALLSASFCLQGCASLKPECLAFYKLDEKRREEEFKTYPVEKQFDLYVCGMEREPPDMGLSYDIARGGPKNVPFLLEKLRAERFDPDKVKILYIFRAMSVLGNFECRKDVIEQLEQEVSGMGMATFKGDARELLDQIKKDSCHAAG